ncbi:MAG: bifunctional folylpolyglutamate synthase/dihydrofolate synthase [Candidatus Bathyarchaeota archaeon]|nr:bifunctional folylpolyglutamate synthase/dihydrofolate synthase [Candidatus Bathyarchaeota archaeon]
MPNLDYSEAIEWMFGIRRFGQERTLDPEVQLLDLLNNPQKGIRVIHVTGTNGKGSTSTMAASILTDAGYTVGLFTSPHLESFTERIQVNGEKIAEKDVARLATLIRPFVERLNKEPERVHPLFFDIITAMAFTYFKERRVNYAVLEVGMGGRLDATNVVEPDVSIITNISLEHTEVLGDTVLKIAAEKGGIIKPGRPLITATQDPDVLKYFKHRCETLGSLLIHVGTDITFTKREAGLDSQRFTIFTPTASYDVELYLLGDHQMLNASAAVGAIEALTTYGNIIPKDAILEGLRNVRWPGRLEVMQRSPLVILDGAKDVAATKALVIATQAFRHKRLVAVISISSDKNIPEMITALAPIVDLFIVTTHNVMGRAADPSIITSEIKKHDKLFQVAASTDEAMERALASAELDDMIIVTGSLFFVGEARRRWRGISRRVR